MRGDPISFVIMATGAFFFWAIKGFNGKLDDEMTRPKEVSKKDTRNFITGIIIIGLIVFLIFI